MPAPWILMTAALLVGAAIAGSRDDSSNSSDDYDDEQATRERAEKERKKAQKQAAKQLLRKQFDERLSEMQETIENNVTPYFLMEFDGYCSIDKYINENNQHDFFGIPLQNTEMRPLRKTAANLNYVREMYYVKITPDTDLHYVLQEIEDYQLTLQEAQQLKESILQTAMKLRGNN